MKLDKAARRKMSREEIASHTYETLLEAALRSVARYGFSKSSVSRITEEAGVAQGTLYSYFGSHQHLLDMLLPLEGERLLNKLGERARKSGDYFEMERKTFYALAEYLDERPYILRLLLEAEVAAPESFLRHMRQVEERYIRAFTRADEGGQIRHFNRRQYQVIAEILAGCRGHIVRHQHARTKSGTEDRRRVVKLGADAYVKFLRGGIGEPNVPEIRKARKLPVLRGGPASDTRTILFEAAGQVIDEVGFVNTTVKAITQRAGVAIGTFYAHFPGRDEFLEMLLVYARRQLTRYIAVETEGAKSFAELEVRGFQAFFDVVRTKPWLVRIAAEAAVWAPDAYQLYLRTIARGYNGKLLAAKAAGEFSDYTRRELIVLGPIFMAARHYLASRYMRGNVAMMPSWIVKTYADFICGGLGLGEGERRADAAGEDLPALEDA